MRMKACYTVFFIIQTAATANFCSTNMVNLAVDNGLMSCFTNNTCIAECYQGYIFPSGNTKESYSCQNGNLTPMLSSCKRIYILAPAAAVVLMLCVAIFLVRLRNRAQAQKREKSYETIITGGQTQYINMADNAHNYDVIGYRREQRHEGCS